MTIEEAKKICGNQPKWCLRNTVKSLSMCTYLNDKEDWKRLEAAKFLLKNT